MPKKAGTNIQYDSVQGKLGDSEVHMIYKSERCYPTYLVTFVL
jgi:hypothetical protein